MVKKISISPEQKRDQDWQRAVQNRNNSGYVVYTKSWTPLIEESNVLVVDKKERSTKIALGELCFWCWTDKGLTKDVFTGHSCRLSLCQTCLRKHQEVSMTKGMQWWAETYNRKKKKTA